VDGDGGALDAGLLALLLVDDLGLPAMALVGPAEVHPEQHLSPIGGLGTPGTGADGQDRRSVVVLAGEQELRPLAREVAIELVAAPVDLGLQLGVARFLCQLERRLEVVRAGEQAGPQLDLGAQPVGLAQDVLG
jgi:hypothetical protein